MLTAVIGAFVYLRIVLAMYAPPDDEARRRRSRASSSTRARASRSRSRPARSCSSASCRASCSTSPTPRPNSSPTDRARHLPRPRLRERDELFEAVGPVDDALGRAVGRVQDLDVLAATTRSARPSGVQVNGNATSCVSDALLLRDQVPVRASSIKTSPWFEASASRVPFGENAANCGADGELVRDGRPAVQVDDRERAAAVAAVVLEHDHARAGREELVAGRRDRLRRRARPEHPRGSRAIRARRTRSAPRRHAQPGGTRCGDAAAVVADGAVAAQEPPLSGATALIAVSRADKRARSARLSSTPTSAANVDASSDEPLWSSMVTWPSGSGTSRACGFVARPRSGGRADRRRRRRSGPSRCLAVPPTGAARGS